MKDLYLYLISQSVNTGYDTYDSAVVVAKSAESAKNILPGGKLYQEVERRYSWCEPMYVEVKLLGPCIADYSEGDVVCASFNAG